MMNLTLPASALHTLDNIQADLNMIKARLDELLAAEVQHRAEHETIERRLARLERTNVPLEE